MALPTPALGSAAPRRDAAVDALAALVQALRTLQTLTTGEEHWIGLGLTMAQLKALMLVVETGGLSSRQLADRLGVGPSAVTPQVDQLVRGGLVRRVQDATDRRVAWVRPTTKALAVQQKLIHTKRSIITQVLNRLAPGDRADVERALQRLAAAAGQALTRARMKVSR